MVISDTFSWLKNFAAKSFGIPTSPVVTLARDARTSVSRVVTKTESLVNEMEGYSSGLVRGSEEAIQFASEMQPTLDGLKSMLLTYREVLRHDAWNRCHEEPVYVSPFDESTAQNFFGRNVSGAVFLFRNAFYEVIGRSDSGEAALILADYVRSLDGQVERVEIPKPADPIQTFEPERPVTNYSGTFSVPNSRPAAITASGGLRSPSGSPPFFLAKETIRPAAVKRNGGVRGSTASNNS